MVTYPTYAELSAEGPWWNREQVTPEVDWLGDQIAAAWNIPRSNIGVKGDNKHLRGAHRSQEWIKRSDYCTNTTYTVESGLTAEQETWLAGVDITPHAWGTDLNEQRMRAMSARIINAMKAGELPGVREFYGTLDGKTVTGYRNDLRRTASSDDSHLQHGHLTIYRHRLRDRALMEQIRDLVLGDEDMPLTDADVARIWAAMDAGKDVNAAGALHAAHARAESAYAMTKLLATKLDAVLAAVNADDVDEQAIVAAVLAGLSPEKIAAAIPVDLAERVADELRDRLAS